MQAFRILLHALRQVFGSFQQALVMSVLPLMLGLAAGFGLFVIGALAHRQDGSVGGFLFTVFLILVLLMAWLAVRWQRVSDLLCMSDPVHASPKGSMHDDLQGTSG